MSVKKVFLTSILVVILSNAATAQTAMNFFHTGANLYIKGYLQQAEQVVRDGLQRFPDDPYLQALA